MSRKSGGSSYLVLAFLILIGMGGILGVSSLNVKISLISGVIVIVAVLESVLILGGFALLKRSQVHPVSDGDSN
jgi:hypothetical protein